jgi:hypothetical protein
MSSGPLEAPGPLEAQLLAFPPRLHPIRLVEIVQTPTFPIAAVLEGVKALPSSSVADIQLVLFHVISQLHLHFQQHKTFPSPFQVEVYCQAVGSVVGNAPKAGEETTPCTAFDFSLLAFTQPQYVVCVLYLVCEVWFSDSKRDPLWVSRGLLHSD